MLFTTEEIVPTSCDTMTMAMRRFNSWRMRYSSFSNWLSTKLAGSSRISSRVSEMIARTAVSLWAVPALGYIAVCFGDPTAWIAADLFLVPAFVYVYGRLKRMTPPEKPIGGR